MKQQPQMMSSNKKKEPDFECCGLHEVCEKESLRAVEGNIDYYEDEELDGFKGCDPSSYNDKEVEQFRDVLYTLKPDEIMAWERSVKKRGIALPDVIKEELISLVNER